MTKPKPGRLPKGAYRLPTGGIVLPSTTTGDGKYLLRVTLVLREEPLLWHLAQAVIRHAQHLSRQQPAPRGHSKEDDPC